MFPYDHRLEAAIVGVGGQCAVITQEIVKLLILQVTESKMYRESAHRTPMKEANLK